MATTGEKLNELRVRAGEIPYAKLAKKMHLAGGSSVQRYFDPGYDSIPKAKWLYNFADVVVGLGHPPITYDEVISIGGYPTNAAKDRGAKSGEDSLYNDNLTGLPMEEVFDLAVEALSRLPPELRKQAYFTVIDNSQPTKAQKQNP